MYVWQPISPLSVWTFNVSQAEINVGVIKSSAVPGGIYDFYYTAGVIMRLWPCTTTGGCSCGVNPFPAGNATFAIGAGYSPKLDFPCGGIDSGYLWTGTANGVLLKGNAFFPPPIPGVTEQNCLINNTTGKLLGQVKSKIPFTLSVVFTAAGGVDPGIGGSCDFEVFRTADPC